MGIMETFNYYYYDLADSRMTGWFLLGSVWSPITIVLIYMIFIYKLVPAYMENRPAYKLNTFIKCYNFFQVIANAYLVKEFSSCYPFLRAFECRPMIFGMDSCSIRIMKATYLVTVLKIIDLIETVVFILRKKNSQVTFLHVYHHISTVLLGLIFSRYFAVELLLLLPILNCSVHVVMYSYYFLSNFEGPIKQIISPFKRYLTIIQMSQFVILMIQIIFALPEDCPFPKKPIYIMMVNLTLNMGLFYNFYRRTYIDSKSKEH